MHSETTCQYLIERGGTQEKFESISYNKSKVDNMQCNSSLETKAKEYTETNRRRMVSYNREKMEG